MIRMFQPAPRLLFQTDQLLAVDDALFATSFQVTKVEEGPNLFCTAAKSQTELSSIVTTEYQPLNRPKLISTPNNIQSHTLCPEIRFDIASGSV